jgi:glutamate carboxypeptidase
LSLLSARLCHGGLRYGGAARAADISFTAGRVVMALDGLGLMGEGGHTARETADLTTLPSQTKRAAVLMYRLRDLDLPR